MSLIDRVRGGVPKPGAGGGALIIPSVNPAAGPGEYMSADPAVAILYNGAGYDIERNPVVFVNVVARAVVAGTPQAIWTPAAGKKFRLMGWNLSLSVAGSIIFKQGGAEFLRGGSMPIGQANQSPWIGNGILGAVAAQALQLDVSASGTVNGFVFGCEE